MGLQKKKNCNVILEVMNVGNTAAHSYKVEHSPPGSLGWMIPALGNRWHGG